jgi:hypothetical protein
MNAGNYLLIGEVMTVTFSDLKFGKLRHAPSDVFKLLVTHVNRYPQMMVQDVYKFLYQGTMGSEHFQDSITDFENDLMDEWQRIEPDNSFPIWENIRPDGHIIRFYLAPFKAREGQLTQFMTLSYWTTTLHEGNVENLKSSWETFEKLCREKKWDQFAYNEVEEFGDWLRKNQFPPVHHSEMYRNTYRPSYRLLLREFLGVLTTAPAG